MQSLIPFRRVNARWLIAGVLLMFASSFGQTFFIAVFAGAIRALSAAVMVFGTALGPGVTGVLIDWG